MSPVTWIVVGFITLASALVVVATFALVVQRVRRLAGTVRGIRDDVQPELARLRASAEVARTELERVSDAREDLRASRD